MKEYKKIILFLIFVMSLKIASAFFIDHYSYFSLRDFFASVLNAENIVSLTNESRRALGLKELKINPKLESAAQKKAEDMLKNQYFSHISQSKKAAWNFMDDAGYFYLFAGENLAMNFTSPEEVMEGWIASISHKENILSDLYTEIGVGITAGKFLGAHSTIIVQMFGKPLRSSAFITKKTTHLKRPVRLSALTKSLFVKNVSLKKYIAKLVQNNVAQWMPSARIHEVYAFSDAGISTKSILDMLFIYIIACGASVFAWRFFRKKYMNSP